MSRLKINVKIPNHIRELLQDIADIDTNIGKINSMTNCPEIAELIDSQNMDAIAVCEFLCKELNIVGHINKQLLQNEEEYYEDRGRLKQGYAKRYS